MQTGKSYAQPTRRAAEKLLPHARRRGVALILVLGFLVLISGLVLAFFSSVQTELASAKTYASSANTKQLADATVQLVMGTIRQATSSGSGVAWASQPGMIRTYGTATGGASSEPLEYYKLYSASNMVVDSGDIAKFTTGGDVFAGWAGQPAIFTDLNAPVVSGNKTNQYPIIDPSAIGIVEGFSVTAAPVATSGTTEPNTIPMPVRWLYVLRDGSITAPDDQSGPAKTASFKTAPASKQPGPANPIVGRIAFWTDDETSKININTAAGDERVLPLNTPGAFWDMPRANTNFDIKLATNQVVQREFQRYPGHPATVALNAVFPDLKRDEIAALTPRVSTGGSLGGTAATHLTGATDTLKTDSDRLYASVDELLFKAPDAASGARDPNLPASIITPEAIARSRFFLTAQSRAPEVNLFGLPRIGIWPIHETDSAAYRTASDKLLAFCSTIGGKRYYFTRGQAGGSRTNGSRTLDFNARNQELYNYLRALTGKPVPGFGGPAQGFASKYTVLERDQILTEIYDYIRSTNLVDGLLTATGGQTYTQPKKATGSGQAVPIKITTSAGATKGFGRFATVSEAALQFYATELTLVAGQYRASKMRAVLLLETFSPAQGHTGITPEYYHTVQGLEKLQVTVPGAAGPTTVSLNFPATAVNRVAALDSMHGRIWSGTEGCAPTFFQKTSGPMKLTPGTDPIANYAFISQSDIVIDPTKSPVFDFSGGELKIQIDAPGASAGQKGDKVQVINLSFPEGKNWPLPKGPAGSPGNKDPLKPESLDYNWRISGINSHDLPTEKSGSFQSYLRLVDPADTVRSIEPSGDCLGDMRLIAGREADVPATFFKPHRDYASTTKLQAHGLRLGVGYSYPGGTTGKLVVGASYGSNIQPDMPVSLTGGAILGGGSGTTPGDWDTGMASYMDGPYINKPDEGTTSQATGQTGNTTPYFTNTDDFGNAQALFSPNRQIASPVMFGSLSTGVIRGSPWQTLLFRPDAKSTHPGSVAPKDHLLLDLFTMPIVEPYAISEPCSTAGKISMNYQIAPFTYIKRETAMRAALQAIWTMAIPSADGGKYKNGAGAATYRTRVDAPETLTQFQKRFDDNRLFVSASEICDIELVPEGGTAAGMEAYWAGNGLTGDNVREMPYNHLYPLLTTKSNTYTVHFRVQTLKKRLGAGITATDPRWLEWDESKDAVLGDYRGSTLIERFIDSSDPDLPDFASNDILSGGYSLDKYPGTDGKTKSAYKLRVLSTKKFGL